jgi:hypothetical protein
MQELYHSDHLNIELEDTIPCLLITWKGFTSSEVFRAGVDKILALMEEYQIHKTITDLTNHRVIGIEDQDYAAKKSLEFDRTHWAVKRALIRPKDVFTRFGIKNVNQMVEKENHQDRQFFENIEEAIAWLQMTDKADDKEGFSLI